jgi:hypothetical protein
MLKNKTYFLCYLFFFKFTKMRILVTMYRKWNLLTDDTIEKENIETICPSYKPTYT